MAAESGWFYFGLGVAGFGASLFLVPLQAYLTDEAPDEKRGAVLSASSLLNNLGGMVGVFLQAGFQKLGVSPQTQLLIASVLVIWITVFVMRLLPRQFVRFLIEEIVRRFYRVEAFHPERMPREGGVLLVPNHVSFVDVLVLSLASPRHVRFLMIRRFFDVPVVGQLARMFDTIAISPSRAKDAIRLAAEALEEGSVVCIFPEGQLTRTGMLNEIKSGYSLIARKAKCPILPVYMDGLWGSIFSPQQGRFFWKKPSEIPRKVRVSFGEVCEQKTDYETLRVELSRQAAWAISKRPESGRSLSDLISAAKLNEEVLFWWQEGELRRCCWGEVKKVLDGVREPEQVASGHEGARRWLSGWREMKAMSDEEFRAVVCNASQWMEPGDCGDRRYATLVHSGVDEAVWQVWGMLLPLLLRTSVVVMDEGDDLESLIGLQDRLPLRNVVGGSGLRSFLDAGGERLRDLQHHDFDGEVQAEPVEVVPRYRGMVFEGKLIAISMPDPPLIRQSDLRQPGWKEGSYGRVLSGIMVEQCGEGLCLTNPMWEEPRMLEGFWMDEEGFLHRVEEKEKGRQ